MILWHELFGAILCPLGVIETSYTETFYCISVKLANIPCNNIVVSMFSMDVTAQLFAL